MEMLSAAGANADQIAYWNSAAGLKWVRYQEQMDRTLAPVAARLMALAQPSRAEHVLDIGCGTGVTTYDIARLVGVEGRALGVDISAPMLELARNRGVAAGGPQFVLADAATAELGKGRFDLVMSRFGVMFFADPKAAFANIHASLKPGGRLAFACWQSMKLSPWFLLPLQAALTQVPPPEPSDPHAPGPFAFADRTRTESILTAAGFSGIAFHPVVLPLALAPPGPDPLKDAVSLALEMGPASRLLQDASEAQRQGARAALSRALEPFVKTEGIALDGAIWLVSASA